MIAFVLAAVLLAAPAYAQVTVAADHVADSVGVNIHLHHNDSLYYDNFPLTRQRLQELGVRHVRDGLIDTTWQPYYDRHNELGRLGIKGTFVSSMYAPDSLLEDYPKRMADSFEAYEGPNEPNWSGDAQWVDRTREVLDRLRRIAGRFPVYGTSPTEWWAFDALGDVSAFVDFGNLHNYFAGRHPGTPGWGDFEYGSINFNLMLARKITGTKPVVTTETGYLDRNVPGANGPLPQEVIAKYLPRLILEHYRRGIRRTFLYELVDSGGRPEDGSFGLLDEKGMKKPAFDAVRNLLSLLSDPGPVFTLQPLHYSVSEAPDLRAMAFARRDGSYLLALWLESEGYDVNAQQPVQVKPQSVDLTLPSGYRVTGRVDWQPNGSTTRASVSGTSLFYFDSLTLLEIEPAVLAPPHGLRIYE